ncbi:Translation machinery-associated protein 22 [Exophiala dermatitidis]|nr:Translation machinery-associated protein 22 [Exophiala dermatitidis]KAJ4559551.1 Translation machinery-associated protein 22 [Exophiala dermatitidis]
MSETVTETAAPAARQVIYCGVCSLPPEVGNAFNPYCAARPAIDMWTNSIASLGKLYSEEALSANLSALSVDAQKRAEKDSAKKAAKAAAAEQREAERKAEAIVLIKRVERNKRKYVTVVSGLEEHGLDLKKVAKELGKKFATGSSVTKTAAGGEEITVQGDVSDDLYDWLLEKYPAIPEDNLDMKDDTKKKAG